MIRALTALLLCLPVLWSAPAAAAAAPADSGPDRILSPVVVAEHLAEDPVYVHPDRHLDGDRSTILSRVRAVELSERVARELPHVYVAVTPWQNAPRSMATALANRAETEGTYLVVGTGHTVVAVRSDGDRTPGPSSDTVRMALAVVNERPDMARADLDERLDLALDLLGDERAAAREYERLASGSEPGRRTVSLVVVLVASLPLVGLGLWALRRRALRPVRVVPLSEAVVDTVDSAAQEELRRELTRDLPSYGRRVAHFKGPRSRASKALATYEAAARVLDTAGDMSDLVGVRVLLDHCEAADGGSLPTPLLLRPPAPGCDSPGQPAGTGEPPCDDGSGLSRLPTRRALPRAPEGRSGHLPGPAVAVLRGARRAQCVGGDRVRHHRPGPGRADPGRWCAGLSPKRPSRVCAADARRAFFVTSGPGREGVRDRAPTRLPEPRSALEGRRAGRCGARTGIPSGNARSNPHDAW